MTVCNLRKQAYELFSSHNFFRKKKTQTKIKLIFQRESTQFQRKEIYDVTKKK